MLNLILSLILLGMGIGLTVGLITLFSSSNWSTASPLKKLLLGLSSIVVTFVYIFIFFYGTYGYGLYIGYIAYLPTYTKLYLIILIVAIGLIIRRNILRKK